MSLNRILLLLLIFYSLPDLSVFAQTKADCTSDIGQARSLIDQSDYDAALPLLNKCLLDEGIAIELRIEANRLLGKAGVALGDKTGALAAFKALLKLSPLYELDPNEDKATLEVFNQARFDFFSGEDSGSKSTSKDWPWIAVAGGVVATLIVLML